MLPAKHARRRPRPAVAEDPARADQQVDLAQVLAGALDDPALGADHDLAAARVPAQRQADGRAGDLPRRRRARRRRRAGTPGRHADGVRRPPPGRREPAASAVVTARPAHAEVALDGAGDPGRGDDLAAQARRPRGRARRRCARRWSRRRRRRPRRHARRRVDRGQQLDAGQHHVGGRALDHRREVVAAAQVLAADHVGAGTSRGSRPGPTPGRARRCGARRCRRARAGRRARTAATSRLGVDVARDHDRAAPAGRRQRAGAGEHTSVLPPSVPPVSSTTSGSLGRSRRRSSPSARRGDTATTLPPLDSATRRPASAVTSSSLPTTAIRSPPPALEQASVGAPAARGSASTSCGEARVVPVEDVGVDGGAVLGGRDAPPSARSTSAALVNVEPKSTQTTSRPAQPRARSRSAIRSSAVSMPTLSRIRSAGTSSSVPATLAWVIRPGVLDQALDAAERLAEREHLGARADVERRLLAAGVPEADHAAEALHLPRGHGVAGVLGQARVDHLRDLRVPGQELDDLLGVVAVPVHPDARASSGRGGSGSSRTGRARRPWRSGGR